MDESFEILNNAINIKKLQLKKYIHEMITDLQSPIDKITTSIYKHCKEEISFYTTNDIKVIIYPDLLFGATDIAPEYEILLDLIYYMNIYVESENCLHSLFFYQGESEKLKIKIKEFAQKGIIIMTDIPADTKISVVLDAVRKRNATKNN